jgi:plasmid maintenance system antidote protein VapI
MRQLENMGIPEKIKIHLDKHGTKQSWLAEKTGLSQAHISNILANRSLLTEDVLDKINIVLGTNFKK